MVRARVLLLAALLLPSCMRAVPIRAPVVVVVDGVRDGVFLTSAEGPEDTRPTWQSRDEVEVEWQGAWFPAVILDKRGTRWLVHYEGYGSDWDEVVGADRLRERRASLVPETAPVVEDEPDP